MKNRMAKAVLPLILAVSSVVTVGTLVGPARATPVDCETIASFASQPEVVQALSAQVAGTRKKLTWLKTLRVDGLTSLSVDSQCNVRARLNITVERRVRRDASGSADVTGKVSIDDGGVACLNDLRVSNLNLSHLLNVGELAYTLAANALLPHQICAKLF